MTETFLTDDDVAALEALESGGNLNDDQVGRLQQLENTPFFADSIRQAETGSQRFTGAGFAGDGSYVGADPSSPMVQAQQDPVPAAQGPLRGEEELVAPEPQPAADDLQFNLVTPPPAYVEERETNIRGPRLGAMGPAMESGDFYANDEELLDALRSAPAQGRVLTTEEHRTMLELEENESDKLGVLKDGAGMIASGLWEMAKGIVLEQGITAPGAIGQALGNAAFDPANAATILKQGMVTATDRVVQGEVTKLEGARKGYIGMRQIWSWFNGFIENDQIVTDQRQAVMSDLRQAGAFGADNVANAQLVEREIAQRREQGLAPFAPTDRTQEFDIKYDRYLENERLNRAYTGQNQYLMGEQVVNERPGIVADQLITAFNPVTGEQVEPLPYTSMGYGMLWQPDTYVGFGAGYLSKARVVSRAAAAARPLFSIAENTAIKAAEVAKTGRDAHKFFNMSNLASGGALATGVGMQFNQSTGDLGKALMFFGGIKPTMRAAGFVFKKVPGGARVMEAAGVFRPQALRIIAEESKAGPLGAGATAQSPATQAAAIRAARPAAAQGLINRGGVPDRYARFMGTSTTRAGDVKISAPGARGFDSTLKRVAQNPENPPKVRRAARAADELGLTQAFRTTDDAISGALAGLVGSSPFAAIAPDDQTAGGILAAGTAFGAGGGIFGGVTRFKGDAVDADIARFMVDTEAYGGDTQALFQIPRQDLAAMAGLQSMAVNKGVDLVALRTEDFLLNVPEAPGAQGYFASRMAKDGESGGRVRMFVDLGHSVVEPGGVAKVTKAADGMYELTVVKADGKVMYPAPASNGSQPVIRRKSPNDFTVKDGDPVSPYSPLNRQSPRVVASAHEFMHALMHSDMFGGDHQGSLRAMVYDQYKPDTINSMAREYAQRLVDAQVNNGAVPKPVNDEARAKMIDDMMTELSDDSVSRFGDQRAWIADEILSETWQDIAQTTDINRIRQGKSADGRVTDAARSMMIATTRALETFGMKFDWASGKPLTNPSTVFRDNPLANTPLIRKRLLEAVRNYDRYLTLLEDAGAVESKGSPLPRSGNAADWLADGTMRTHDVGGGIKENDVMIVDPDGQVRWKPQDQINREHASKATAVSDMLKRHGSKKVGANDPAFGLRDAGPMRTIYSGAELPMEGSALGYPPVLAAFPKWYREMYMGTILPAQRAGETVRFSNNTVGTRSDKGGPYQVKQLISSGFAKQSEGVPFGVQITKSGGHINIEMIDLNSFKAAALKAINDGKISFFNNDYKQVVAGLKQLMDNYRNKRDGSYMIGEEGKNILNGLLYGKSRANAGYGAALNPRGSIRTYRMDRMNWMERTGDDGYFFDNDRAKNNRMPSTEPVDGPDNNRMPSALPQAGMAMPDAPVRGERADIPLNPRARQAAFISDRGEVRATGRATHFETNEDLGPDFLAIGAGHLGEDGFFRFGSQSMDEAMGDSPETSSAAAARFNQSAYDQGRRPSSMLEEPPGLERPAARGQAMADVGGQQTMVQRNPAGDYEPLGMLKKQKNGNWAVYTAPMMAANKDGTQTMLPPSKLAEYPTEAKARARAEKEFFTSLPLQDAKQYLGARERQAITEAQQRIAEVAKNNPEAARLEVTRDDRGLPKVGLIEDADGNPVLDARGNQKFGAIYRKAQYDLRKAPGLSKDEARAVQQAADLMEADARRGQANPAIAKGIGWYGRMRGWLQQAYGATIELFGQLLGATSARTPVDTNFIQAREALQIFGRGGYDDLLGRFDAFVMQKKADADSGKMEADWRKKGGKGTFKLQDEYRKQVNKFDEVPLRGNGKKYNANSTKVLHALYGNWITQTKGPKTPNFAGNLTGRTFKATIDVWAARNLRRLLYEGKSKRWRILPEQEQGVADADFFFGQKVYDEVGRRMGIPTDDLQALQWFNEKDIWETNDWTDKTGAEKSSFDKEAGKLSVDRYQVGLTTFQDAAGFDPAVQRAELTAFRNSVRAQEGLEAARVTESEGLYGNVVEPTFDAEFSVNRKGEVSPSIEPIIRQAIDTANRNKQNDVFISAVVEEAHPNARPMVEVGFKSAASRAEIDAVTAVFRGAGIDGFTVARNERGDVLGIRAQYVPEISARYDTLDHLDPAQFAVKSGDWVDRARSAIASLENQDNVSYRKEGHVSTNVYGIEEYGSVTPADILRSNARQELGRRRAILAAGTR